MKQWYEVDKRLKVRRLLLLLFSIRQLLCSEIFANKTCILVRAIKSQMPRSTVEEGGAGKACTGYHHFIMVVYQRLQAGV